MERLSRHDRVEFIRYCRDLNSTKLEDVAKGERAYLARNRWDGQAKDRFNIARDEMKSRTFTA